jgi:hypothetical protein
MRRPPGECDRSRRTEGTRVEGVSVPGCWCALCTSGPRPGTRTDVLRRKRLGRGHVSSPALYYTDDVERARFKLSAGPNDTRTEAENPSSATL